MKTVILVGLIGIQNSIGAQTGYEMTEAKVNALVILMVVVALMDIFEFFKKVFSQ